MEKKYTPEEIVLLDHYAGLAMQGMVTDPKATDSRIPADAWKLAAAMIEERKKYIQ